LVEIYRFGAKWSSETFRKKPLFFPQKFSIRLILISTPTKSQDDHSLSDKDLHLKYLITTRFWAMPGSEEGNLPDAVELD
jgi:hypothetical protein